jgi:ribonucleoside-triphosphate reductase (thioredoxin)
MKSWSNLAKVVALRTYARPTSTGVEDWDQIVERAIAGNVRGFSVPEAEVKELLRLAKERKAGPAGRGYWFSGTDAHEKIGGTALCNCWYLNSADWNNYIIAMDYLMLGGGVGFSVEHRFSSKLPKVKGDVNITHKGTNDADYIVPDSREGWCKLIYRVLEAWFVTGKSFTYSTVCLRGFGQPIKGFGGVASGPIPLIEFIETINNIMRARQRRHLRPIDAADIMTAMGQMVVAGNVRRSAIIILGDCFDKEFLRAKRWDLGTVPAHRGRANYSVVCDDVDDLHPLFWKTYEEGEPFGLVNRTNIRRFGRMGELCKDTAEGVNPCAEATLENGEPCNLMEMALCNFQNEEEFVQASRLMMRYGKRVCLNKYHQPLSQEVIRRNMRVGIGITGVLSSTLFQPTILDRAYLTILEADAEYSKELNVPLSIRHTVVKPSGTMGKVLDCNGEEGVHAALAPYIIQRVQFAANDRLVPRLRAAGHPVEPKIELDGSYDSRTVVVSFYVAAPEGAPTVETGWDTWKQLNTVLMAQKYWADQSVSVTVYYRQDEISRVKAWLADNLCNIKTISFLKFSEHGFRQAPKEPITKEHYERAIDKIKPLCEDIVGEGELKSSLECEGGACPVK